MVTTSCSCNSRANSYGFEFASADGERGVTTEVERSGRVTVRAADLQNQIDVGSVCRSETANNTTLFAGDNLKKRQIPEQDRVVGEERPI
jgi:hypothetical protein